MPFTFPDDHFNGFISCLKGSTAAAVVSSAQQPPSSAPAAAHPDPHAPPLRIQHTINGFPPTAIQNYSGALSSDRLSTGAGGGPVSRTFSGLRGITTGEASIGSFSNNAAVLHPIPPSLSADPPLPQPLPQRSPTSPIPHVHMTGFVNNSAYHPYPSLSHLNHSPSSVARQTLNYSPQPPSAPLNHTSQQIPCPVTMPQRLHPHHQQQQPPPHLQQQALPPPPPPPPQQQQQPVRTHHPDAPVLTTQMQQQYPTYAPHPPQMGVYPTSQPDARIIQQQQQHQQPPQMHRQDVPPQPPQQQQQQTPAHTRSITKDKREKRTPTQGPAKRARTVDRPTQLSPTTPRSAAGGTSTAFWGTPGVGSSKSRSGTTAPSVTDTPVSVPGATEEQSRPERKREREKRRRETMNSRFVELSACLTISAGGKSDKEGILAEAVDHVKKQASAIIELEKQNQELQSEARDLRAEKAELRQDKNYIREERDRLKAELEHLKGQLKGEDRKVHGHGHSGGLDEERMSWKVEAGRNGVTKVKEEKTSGMKQGVVKG